MTKSKPVDAAVDVVDEPVLPVQAGPHDRQDTFAPTIVPKRFAASVVSRT